MPQVSNLMNLTMQMQRQMKQQKRLVVNLLLERNCSGDVIRADLDQRKAVFHGRKYHG
jgi:hypothetical protein